MGKIDFQGMHWCQAMCDVPYFLIDSLEPEFLVTDWTSHPGWTRSEGSETR